MKKIADLKNPQNKALLKDFQNKIFIEFYKFLEDLSIPNYKKSALITYWLNDYKNYLSNEDSFSPRKLVKYKRGSIIKVNLGFNLGNEQGGLHYCIVLNKDDTINIPTLNVIPLTSIKDPNKKVHYTTVNLGNEVYKTLNLKIEENTRLNNLYLSNTKSMNKIIEDMLSILEIYNDNDLDRYIKKEILESNKPILDMYLSDFKSILNNTEWEDSYLTSTIETIKDIKIDIDSDYQHMFSLLRFCNNITNNIITIVEKRIDVSKKVMQEIKKMKKGSIAHVDQITTISKMRIFNPKSTEDALYNIRLSDESLTLIDNKIKELFTH